MSDKKTGPARTAHTASRRSPSIWRTLSDVRPGFFEPLRPSQSLLEP